MDLLSQFSFSMLSSAVAVRFASLVFFVLVLCLLFLVQVQKDKYRQQYRRHRSECPSDPFHD